MHSNTLFSGGSKKTEPLPQVDTSSIFKYYKSMEQERQENQEKQKKAEQIQKEYEKLKEKADKKKSKNEKYFKQSSSFKAPARLPMGAQESAIKKPSIGQYYPKYNCIMSDAPSWKIGKSPKKSVFDETAERVISNTAKGFAYDYRKPTEGPAKGSVKFDSMSDRKEFTQAGGDGPHEKRFEPFDNNPLVCSNHRKSPTISLDRTKGHDNTIFKSNLTGIQYNPKYDAIRQRLDKGAINFEKMESRTLNLCQSVPYIKNSSNPENVEKYYKKIDHKKNIPQFAKIYAPVLNDKDPLPKFLQGMNNRIGVMIMGPHGLKANNFANGKFSSTQSSFVLSPKKKHIQRNSQLPSIYDFNLEKTLEESTFVLVNAKLKVEQNPFINQLS